jgi:hypothetical protein
MGRLNEASARHMSAHLNAKRKSMEYLIVRANDNMWFSAGVPIFILIVTIHVGIFFDWLSKAFSSI